MVIDPFKVGVNRPYSAREPVTTQIFLIVVSIRIYKQGLLGILIEEADKYDAIGKDDLGAD